MPNFRIKPAFGARDVLAHDVVGKAVRQERERDEAGERETDEVRSGFFFMVRIR